MKSLIKEKKGQIISITAFFAIMLATFILAVLLIAFVNTILNPVQATFQNMSNVSGNAVQNINNSFNTWWDGTIIVLFFFNVIILLISSYYVDTSPIFLVVYIIAVMLLVIFGGNVVSSINNIWDPTGVFGSGNVSAGGNVVQYIPLTSWFLDNYMMVMLGIIIISGVIMYAKFKSQSVGI